MASNLSQIDVEAQLDLLTRKSQCAHVVCDKLPLAAKCGEGGQNPSNSRCLVDYHYPMSLEETAAVAEEADYAQRIAEARAVAESAAAEEEKLNPVAPFKPDWRFWTGITLSGAGLFLYRSR